MIVRFRKWGNSLAVRIPKPIATAIQATDGTAVELTVKNGTLVLQNLLSGKPNPSYSLDQLLAGMTRENVPEEVDWAPPRGSEVW